MPAPTRPTNYSTPFAESGTRNTIPNTPTGTNKASFPQGFPPVTMQPITAGGIPPSGDDFNGLFYDVFQHIVFFNAGGRYRFDSALSTAMGGYPKGFVLQSDDGMSEYVSMVDNNTTNFNSAPASIGSLWGSYAGAAYATAAISTTGGNTVISAIQAAADIIIVTGTLVSNATLTFPALAAEYVIVNNTIGAFTLTALPSGGTGVQIRQAAADAVYTDGAVMGYQQASAINRNAKDNSRSIANTTYADRAADRVGGGYLDTGAANAYVVATVPATTAPTDYQTVRFRAANPSVGGACTLDVGGGPLPLVCGDGSDPRGGDITNTAITNATFVAALNKWIVNGLIIPDVLISNAIWVTSTRMLFRGNFIISTASGPYACNLGPLPDAGDTIFCADPTGSWGASPLTIAATGGKLIAYNDASGTLQTMTTFVADIRGYSFKLVYDGTYWRLT